MYALFHTYHCLPKTKLPGHYVQGIYIIPHYCRMSKPQSNAWFLFLMAELEGLNSATIDGFAATLRSSFYLGKTPEATPHRPGYSKGQELQDYFPNEL